VTVGTAVAVEVGLRTLRLPTLTRWAGVPLADERAGASPSPQALDLPPDALRRLRMAARVMRYWPFDEKCLRRCLVSGRRIRSLQPTLALGVAVIDGEVKAHAWLTVDGVSLDPWGAQPFAPLVPMRADASPDPWSALPRG
jgi:hypothetical protein